MDELEQARGVARALLAVCPMYALPLDLMWRIIDDPAFAWLFETPMSTALEDTASSHKRYQEAS